jgi:purine nucleosidase
MIDTVLESPGQIEVLALGPLTNIALATLVEPKWAASVKRIIFMGGALSVPGNVAPLSTGNIINDPEAAKIVFHAGAPVVMVGQDVTRFARLTRAHWQRMQERPSKVIDFLADITHSYANFYNNRERSLTDIGYPVHDMLVTAYLLKPSIFKTEKLYVTVETVGNVTRGQTVADRREFSPYQAQMEVCVEADNDALFELYIKRVTRDLGPERALED